MADLGAAAAAPACPWGAAPSPPMAAIPLASSANRLVAVAVPLATKLELSPWGLHHPPAVVAPAAQPVWCSAAAPSPPEPATTAPPPSQAASPCRASGAAGAVPAPAPVLLRWVPRVVVVATADPPPPHSAPAPSPPRKTMHRASLFRASEAVAATAATPTPLVSPSALPLAVVGPQEGRAEPLPSSLLTSTALLSSSSPASATTAQPTKRASTPPVS